MKAEQEQRIARVLAGMRDAEVVAGLEERILRRIVEGGGAEAREQRASSVSRGRSLVSRALGGQAVEGHLRGWVWSGVGLVAALLLVILMRAPGPGWTGMPLRTPHIAAGSARADRTPQSSATTGLVARATAIRRPQEGRLAMVGGELAGRRMIPLTAPRETASPEPRTSRGLADEASFPAPPLPLTDQERLLMGIARKGSEEEWAMLMPEVQAQHMAEEQAEFQRFFEPAPAPAPTEPGKEVQPAVSNDTKERGDER